MHSTGYPGHGSVPLRFWGGWGGGGGGGGGGRVVMRMAIQQQQCLSERQNRTKQKQTKKIIKNE